MSKSNSHPEMQTKSLMSTEPLPASCKVYRNGKMYDDVRVAMREITVSSTPTVNHQYGDSATPGIVVYDTSGPYTDPTIQTDVRKGLEPLRLNWILARGEVEESPTHPIQPSGNAGAHWKGHCSASAMVRAKWPSSCCRTWTGRSRVASCICP